jgi:hypothetical protein
MVHGQKVAMRPIAQKRYRLGSCANWMSFTIEPMISG